MARMTLGSRESNDIPGVGPRTAEILVACIDDPHRFKKGRQVSAYFGLVLAIPIR